MSKYDPDTETLIPDEHLNIYEMDGGEKVDDGLLVDHRKMKGMLEGAKDGYVTLPDGRRVTTDSFRTHVEGNAEILADSAKYKGTRSAHSALENGQEGVRKGSARTMRHRGLELPEWVRCFFPIARQLRIEYEGAMLKRSKGR